MRGCPGTPFTPFDFLHATNDIHESRGVTLPLQSQSTTAPETCYRDGLSVQKSIFGESVIER